MDQTNPPNSVHPSFIPQLDEDFVAYYNEHLAVKKATHGLSIAELRLNAAKHANPWARDFSDLPFVKDIKITTSPFGEGPYPVHVNFHGRLHPITPKLPSHDDFTS